MDDISQESHGTISEAAFARASEWLSYCVEHDEDCTPPNDFWPRRLVNVNLGDEAKDPFLVKPTEQTIYACLSYCWGPDADKVLRTTKDNIEAHFSAIPFDAMPKSVQDAVKVCRRLNIPYLWVDSLCILQDDHNEWLHDSAEMDRTYLNSHLTIAALEPASCTLGFLGPQLYGIQERRPNIEEYWTEKAFSLNRRGWCLQEELLPNRRLCLNGAEMSWECMCRRMCECGHQLWPSRHRTPHLDEFDLGELGGFFKKPLLSVARQRRAKEEDDLNSTSGRKLGWLLGGYDHRYSSTMTRTREVWRYLVATYTQRALSYRRDRLAALAGLAKMTLRAIHEEEDSPDEYLAGLWKREIHFDLAWCIERSVSRLPHSAGHADVREVDCAPSWSWAASNRPVRYHSTQALWSWKCTPGTINKCDLIEAECITELEGDSIGPLLRGRIRLKGALAAVELGMLGTAEGSTELEDRLGGRSPGYWIGQGLEYGTVFVRAKNLHSVAAVMDEPIDSNIRLADNRRYCWLKGKCEGDVAHGTTRSRHDSTASSYFRGIR